MDVWANITRMQESVRYESFRNKGVAREKIVVAYEDMVAGRMTDLESYLGVTLPSDMSSVNLGPFGYTKRSGASGNWRAFFTEEDVKILRPLIGAKRSEEHTSELQSLMRISYAVFCLKKKKKETKRKLTN